MTDGNTRFDRLATSIKKNRLVAAAILVATLMSGLAAFTDATQKLLALLPARQSPVQARAELARLSIPFTPDAFRESAKTGDAVAVSLFSAAGMDPNVTDDDGGPPLMYAAYAGHANIVTNLIHAGADVNKRSGDSTALASAASGGHLDVVRLLLDAGSNADAINGAFVESVEQRQDAVMRLLVDKGADVKRFGATAMQRLAWPGAAKDEDVNTTVALLLELGADPNGASDEGLTTLLIAAANGYVSVVRTLLAHGADVNARCTCPELLEGGWTPLLRAVSSRHQEVAQLLLEKGADVNARNNRGETALELARRYSPGQLVELLKRAGAK